MQIEESVCVGYSSAYAVPTSLGRKGGPNIKRYVCLTDVHAALTLTIPFCPEERTHDSDEHCYAIAALTQKLARQTYKRPSRFI